MHTRPTPRLRARFAARVTALLVALAAMLATLFAASSAQAQTAPSATAVPGLSRTLAAPAHNAAVRSGAGSGQFTLVRPDITITCTLNVQNPHNSSHVAGTVNVVATITCDAPVSALAINVGLYFNGALVASSGPVTNAGSAFIQGNAAVPCANGTYTGGATGAVIFPAGFSPPSGTWPEVFGNTVSITC